MPKISYIDVSEQQLEDLIRQYANSLSEGLRYIHHQRITGSGRLDMLLIDSGNALVLAELKVIEDDGMLFQAQTIMIMFHPILEAFARLYSDKFAIDPTQLVRLFLIALAFPSL